MAQTLLRFLLAIFSAWIYAGPVVFAKPDSQTVQAFKLIQSHLTLGHIDVYYTNDAVKMVLKENGTTLIARAPTWKVVLYRTSGRVAYESPLADFRTHGLRFVPVPYIPGGVFHSESVEHVNGETVVELSEKVYQDRNYRYWVIEPVTIPNEACEILEQAVRVPYRHAIPLKLTGDEPGHEDLRSHSNVAWHLGANEHFPGGRTPVWRIQTFKWSKVTLPRSEFDYPVGYKCVHGEPDVFMTDRTREVFEDLIVSPSDSEKKSDPATKQH